MITERLPPLVLIMAAEEEPYRPKDAISQSIQGTLIVGGAGLLISAVQNTLAKQNVGAWGIFTRTGGTVGTFGLILKQRFFITRLC